MAIKKESIIALAAALKIDKKVIEDAIAAADEQEIKIPEGLTVLTTAELTARDEQNKNSGINSGKQIAIKDLKEAAGLDYEGEGSKDGKRFLTEYEKKVKKDSNVQESDKIKELNTTIEGLRTNITTLTGEKDSMIKATKEAQLDNDILTMTIDKKPDNFTNKEWLTLIKLGNEVVEDNGITVVKRDGKVVANKTDLKPLPVKEALVGYIDERKLGKVVEPPKTGGRNGQDSKITGLGISTMKQFTQHLQDNNISANGEQAKAMLKEITEANANFDFNTK